ncbi:UNVERIFIED_CONTAM: hypothetical protein Slati_4401200 [Sesamum latifolium]|uniref:Integrase catalytic domain-containing protein n=1 Tax=Sesamum latifolium TaxID=2727402 RepID=A0AAW2SQG3_9LAMI
MFVAEVNMISNSASWVLDTGYGAHICNNLQVLETNKKLRKDEMILSLGDGKAIAVEAVGSLSLIVSNRIRIDLKDCYFVPINGLYILQQSNLIMTAQHKCKVDNHENAHIWHAMLGHISKDRIRRLVDSKSLKIDNLDHLPTCESCLKGKMTKKPFVGQSAIANGLLDLVHTDAFGRFKEYRFEVKNQTNRKIKALWSDRGGEYLSGEFIDYLKENGILSQWTPPGMPELNGVAERRNRTLLDMMPYDIWHGKPASYKYLRVWGSPTYVKRLVGDKLDSRSSLCRFIVYPKEIARYYFYDPIEQKTFVSRNAVFLKKSFPSDSRRDEVLIKESNEELQNDNTTSFEPTVHTDGVPLLHRSIREFRVPERYGFMGLTS